MFGRKQVGEPTAEERNASKLDERPAWMVDGMRATLLEGHETLDVVGGSLYQDNLWQLAGGQGTRASAYV